MRGHHHVCGWTLLRVTIHVAGSVFAEDVYTLFAKLEPLESVRFAIPMKLTKQIKSMLRK